jgi:hypothetical protein
LSRSGCATAYRPPSLCSDLSKNGLEGRPRAIDVPAVSNAQDQARAVEKKTVDELDSIGFFYHDSDRSYKHMMFESHEAKRKVGGDGLVVNDDVILERLAMGFC